MSHKGPREGRTSHTKAQEKEEHATETRDKEGWGKNPTDKTKCMLTTAVRPSAVAINYPSDLPPTFVLFYFTYITCDTYLYTCKKKCTIVAEMVR